MTEGVLAAREGNGSWAWVAVRLHDAVEAPGAREAGAGADQVETGWLAGQWETAHDTRIELRYRAEQETVSCALLGRVQGNDTVSAALALRERLAGAGGHVRASPVEDGTEVRNWLVPFTPDPAGLVDVRKRLRTATPNRPDAGVRYYLAVQPFTIAADTWEPVWQALVAHPHPVVLTIGLHSYAVPTGFATMLNRLATQYGRLARPGWSPGGLWSSGTALAPDAFAAEAEHTFRAAASRYSATAFRIRITLASPQPLPSSLAERIATTVSPPAQRPFPGAAHVLVRPDHQEFPVAERNLTTLEHLRWDSEYLRGLPEPPPPLIRLLAELVDSQEAATMLRFPLAVGSTAAEHVHNVMTGDATNVVQTGEIHGGVHFHVASSTEDTDRRE
jgi:hypothetical protein